MAMDTRGRRDFLKLVLLGSMASALATPGATQSAGTLKIGVIGSGRIGGTLGGLFAKAGHAVMFSDREPAQAQKAAMEAGASALTGSASEAAAFGEVVLIAVPYNALPAVAAEVGTALKGKVVIDPNNPIASRDGEMGAKAKEAGAAVSTAAMFPGVRTVRAFNSIGYQTFQREAHRAAPRMAVPLAADDAAALKIGAQLIADAGFDPVPAGTLAQSTVFDLGSRAGDGRPRSAAEMRALIGQ